MTTSAGPPLTLARAKRGFGRALSYWRRFGLTQTLRRTKLEWQRRNQPPIESLTPAGQPAEIANVGQWLQARFPAVIPLPTYRVPAHDRRRVTLVTDSIGKGSLFGGVGTALIFGALLANRRDAHLRVLTRTEPPVPASVAHVLGVYGIELQREIEFQFLPADDRRSTLGVIDGETMLTTSWWTTAATLPSVPPQDIVYLLQEDERMFYPFGDERMRCERVMAHAGIQFVVNTQLLFDHFVSEGFQNIGSRGLHFEPAFPPDLFKRLPRSAEAKRRFFFYARPNNSRNLFFLGIEVIDRAIAQGLLDPATWDIVFVGKDIPDLRFSDGSAPQRIENLDWRGYARMVGETDLALTLMYTPHPSYPPLDLVTAGAVVVTNRHGPKQDLSALSPNLICCELERDALVDGIRRGVDLVRDEPRRHAQHLQTRMPVDWAATLAPVVDALSERR